MSEIVARIHIVLADVYPAVWRRVDFPIEANLKMLHDVIQGAMGWHDSHLWDFVAGDRRYGVPDREWDLDETVAAKNAKLRTLIDRGIRQFVYTYDMGDNWEHFLTVESLRQGDPDTAYPRYVEGARRAPPEDCGGIPGFEAFLEAVSDAAHPEHADATAWHRDISGEDFDPETFDELQAKLAIGAIAKRRRAGRASQAKHPY